MLWFSLFSVSPVSAEHIVLRFHDDPQVSGAVVRLRDIVEIASGSVPSLDRLRDLPLGPAPQEGVAQNWHSSDVLQHLELRGVHPGSVRWTGKEHVQLYRTKDNNVARSEIFTPAFTDQRTIDIATANVALAIKEYLSLQTRSRTDWRLDVTIPVDQARSLQSRSSIVSIGGGQEPWTGSQTFVIQVKNQGKVSDVQIPVVVGLPPMIVVASGPLRRDQMLTEQMVSYAPLPRNSDERHYFTDVQSLIGKQLRKSVSTGQAISEDLLGEPIVIQRNDLIEVESVAGAITVKTTAKSLGAGAVGDLIDVEMPNRRRLMATVIGPARVRISATSMSSRSR